MFIFIDILISLIYLILVYNNNWDFFYNIVILIFMLAFKILAHVYSKYFLILIIPCILFAHSDSTLYLIIFNILYLIIYFYFNKIEKINKEQKETITSLESLLSQSKTNEKNIKLYIGELKENIRLNEKNYLSQQIHDMIGHNLSGALLQLEVSKKFIDKDKDKAKEMTNSSIKIIRNGIDEIRLFLKENKPEVREIGLSYIRNLLDDYSKQTGIHTGLDIEGNCDKITPIHWKTIQDNIKEALSNVSKHSKAKNINVKIEVYNKILTMIIEDDGGNFSNFGKGMGLIGMEERAAFLNGKVIFDINSGMKITTILEL